MTEVTHWFHRNYAIKATGIVSFDLRTSPTSTDAMQICGELRRLRLQLLHDFCDPSLDAAPIRDTFNTYISYLLGFIISPNGSSDDSKLRYTTKFYWSDSLTRVETITDVQDAQYELICMTLNMAFWYTKHAAFVASKNTVPIEKDALEIHKSLRIAAGIFKQIQDVELRKLSQVKLPPASDLNEKILSSYYYQCMGEFHEVTVARAMQAKQNNALICSICHQVSQFFDMGAQHLVSFDERIVGQWRMYMNLKSKFYLCEARAYQAASLMEKNDAPNALRSIQEAGVVQIQAASFCERYAKNKKESPINHPFFQQLDAKIRRIHSSVEFENNMIHHKKPANEVLPLDASTPSHGILPHEEYVPAKLNTLFSPEAYNAFDIGRNVGKPLKEDKHAKEVKEAREVPIPQQGQSSSSSSCVLS